MKSIILSLMFLFSVSTIAADIPSVVSGENISASKLNEIITELNKLKSARHVVKTFSNASSWYEICNDGWVRQGISINNTAAGDKVVTYLIPFKDTNYSATMAVITGYAGP